MIIIKSLLYLIIIFLIGNCTTEPENDFDLYKIKVDKITMADTISVSDTLVIKFDGFVGPNGCHSFRKFEVKNKTNKIDITVWGEKSNSDGACTEALVYLRGKEYKTLLNDIGTYKIIIHQPDNSTMIDSMTVN